MVSTALQPIFTLPDRESVRPECNATLNLFPTHIPRYLSSGPLGLEIRLITVDEAVQTNIGLNFLVVHREKLQLFGVSDGGLVNMDVQATCG